MSTFTSLSLIFTYNQIKFAFIHTFTKKSKMAATASYD